jgi:hypothetical protein
MSAKKSLLKFKLLKINKNNPHLLCLLDFLSLPHTSNPGYMTYFAFSFKKSQPFICFSDYYLYFRDMTLLSYPLNINVNKTFKMSHKHYLIKKDYLCFVSIVFILSKRSFADFQCNQTCSDLVSLNVFNISFKRMKSKSHDCWVYESGCVVYQSCTLISMSMINCWIRTFTFENMRLRNTTCPI